ncbi:MAG TPA: dihydrofolate reductase [Solirubrobacteraceae bacterium]|nr:dihydrofolate reductase [Solirubrobacteraceae bacterium]
MIAIVVAHGANRAIGYRGALPWRLPSDLRHFRELTIGHAVLMGRSTFESLPDAHRPLRERRNIVLSASPDCHAEGAEVYASLDAALRACGEDCFVIGGASVYEQALPLADRVYATEIAASPAGDVFFPALAPAEWHCVQESEPLFESDLSFVFRVYDRAR